MGFQQKELNDFIGKGITLPLRVVNGRVPIDTGFTLIRASIIMILSWEYGTRYFLNEFGSKLGELIEEPNDDVLFNLIETFVQDAIEQWEPRVELISTDINRPSDVRLDIQLTYRIIATQQEDTFIFPFYSQINY